MSIFSKLNSVFLNIYTVDRAVAPFKKAIGKLQKVVEYQEGLEAYNRSIVSQHRAYAADNQIEADKARALIKKLEAVFS